MFAVISILALIGLWLVLAFRRFMAGKARADAERMIHADAATGPAGGGSFAGASSARSIFSPGTLGGFAAWLPARVTAFFGKPGREALTARVKGLRLWRLPILEKWLLIVLYATFLYLAASGFFFAIFIRRGLYGFPLLLHFTAGVIFAVCLALAALLKARNYTLNPAPLALPAIPAGFSLKRDWRVIGNVRLGGAAVVSGLFWLFLLAGLSLTITALFPMVPWFHYQGQQILFGWHRWSALVSLVAAAAFAELEFFAPSGPRT